MPADPLHEVFAQSLNLPLAAVHEQLTYRGVAQWDSISHMALVAALETRFQVMLDTPDVLDLSSVAKARGILQKHGVTP
jgi:acyl carrier protein